MTSLKLLEEEISNCRKCPRLNAWRKEVSVKKRKSYQDQNYWGKPVPGFGVSNPKLLVVGLAPGAHGANRTGRIFTGDRSGDWLYRAMHKAGFANQPTSTDINDGLKLQSARVLTAVRCAPPDNKPTTEERDKCSFWLEKEWKLIKKDLKCIIALGSFAWQETLKLLSAEGYQADKKIPKFKHEAAVRFQKNQQELLLIASYHPSQQNTFTKRLTEHMFDRVFTLAKRQIANS
ncbi:MAG: uracil-DNA glycosylase [Candidatus Nanopelagicales bacterium]